eukprot:TRINITY_DN34145_c0_g1_i1.p2 TRINITY_DN34145_c0_g1~~TRINITY_DN34145_c0_g1_i1.p2  ORF type:complete len:182 (-),score=54.78 TRINITY_DN34145_c0_g1_i1:93-638(-)
MEAVDTAAARRRRSVGLLAAIAAGLSLSASFALPGGEPSAVAEAARGAAKLVSLESPSSRTDALRQLVLRKGVAEEFEGGVNAAKCVLVVRIGCDKCSMAMEALKGKGIKYATIELQNELGQANIPPADMYLDHMERKTGSAELPQVHVKGGAAWGGVDAILDGLDDGTLVDAAKEADSFR